MSDQPNKLNRRLFLTTSALTANAFFFFPSHVLGRGNEASPNDKLNLGIIGASGRGGHNLRKSKSEYITALCDVDDNAAAKTYKQYEDTPKYHDFRVMLDKHSEIDAVVVSTPDHIHAVAALNAIRRKKHVYVEKPLAHNIHEVRTLMSEAQKYGVQTQMGNQGHSYDSIRKVHEWINTGAIGNVSEVHVWFDQKSHGISGRPLETLDVPRHLNWDLWLGPAELRPYNSCYLPGRWRHWFDFGTGYLGDWLCHILDPAYWALDLGAPETITAFNEEGSYSPERFTQATTIEYKFPAKGERQPVTVYWNYGKPLSHPMLENMEFSDWHKTAGAIIVGDKGAIVHGSHGGGDARILPDERADEVQTPEETIPRIKDGHNQDWIRACKDGIPASANFTYGGPLTEVALTGVIATRLNNQTLNWDSENACFTNSPEANRYIAPTIRKGWIV